MTALKIVSLLFLLCNSFLIENCLALTDENSSPTKSKEGEPDLEAAEANGKLEIIKQIKKVNDDGSYTIGYEADDGSFKIESRDVLGNIKGTYGYIDDNGEIKRVSYSTSNTTAPEVITSTNEPPSVVQRIPSKVNRTIPTTTRRPYVVISSTTSAPSTTTASVIIQPIRRRLSTLPATSTTEKHQQFIKEALAASKSTVRPTTIYETSTPARILAQSKPLIRSTTSTTNSLHKSEGQLTRPEIVLKTTDMPLYRRLPIKTTLLDDDTKPVTEEPEHSNVLRRQLPQLEKTSFDPRQHVLNLQQQAGDDTVDVYSSSLTTGSPRPLFTTLRPRILSSTTPSPISRPTPTIRYPSYARTVTPAPRLTSEFTQESSTEATITPSPVPVVQIPANHNEEPQQRQQYVQLRHPFHRGAILVPVTHIPQDARDARPEEDNPQYQTQEPVYVRRVPKYRPIPVHVDENGFIREYSTPTPYVMQGPPIQSQPPRPYLSQNDIINEVDRIKPPVSTRDFQKLLEHLIQRQSRLEKISTLARNPEMYRPSRPVYQEVPVYNAPVQFIPRTQTAQPQQRSRHQEQDEEEQQRYNQYSPVTFTSQPPSSNYPTKRMVQQHQEDEEYLPAPVREMLLLRMLQLAINPSLPLEVMDNLESATTPVPRKDTQIRNVEILGEDDSNRRTPTRTKRFKQVEMDYFD